LTTAPITFRTQALLSLLPLPPDVLVELDRTMLNTVLGDALVLDGAFVMYAESVMDERLADIELKLNDV